jgi:predicted ester cyclase
MYNGFAMSTNPNKALVRRFYAEVISAGDLSRVEAFIAPEYLDHNAEGAGRGPAVLRAHVEAIRRTFPDFELQIDDIVAEGDKVVTRVSGRGTHKGEWMGVRPTGAVVRVKGINIDRIVDGRIAEHWGEADTVGMLDQMGVDPFAGRKKPS